jgi:hypothetical protein
MLLVVLLLVVLLGNLSLSNARAEQTISDSERAKHLERMRSLAGSIRVLADPQRTESAVKLQDEPVLRYADDTRMTIESSLWIWTSGGRPTAILAVEFYPKPPHGPRWLYEIASLSTRRIAAEREGEFRWSAKAPGVTLQAFGDAPPPADKETRRLTQMKQLRARFTAHENATEGRVELRPLTTALVRYADAETGLVDGAIFSLANGTNPEVLLMLEANRVESKIIWQYALVQLTGEPVTVELDGKEIWEQPGDAPPAVRAAYINGWIAAGKE